MKTSVLLLSFFICFFPFTGSTQELFSQTLTAQQFSRFENRTSPRVGYVKFVVFAENDSWVIKYFDSNEINLHVEFLQTTQGFTDSSDALYSMAHYNENRLFFFGAMIKNDHFSINVPDTLSFQLMAQDTLNINDIIRIGQIIKGSVEGSEALTYQPSGNQRSHALIPENKIRLEAAGFPLFVNEDVQETVYNSGYTVGRLKIVDAEDINSGAYQVLGDEILVLNYTPDSLPPVRGVITSTQTSPNSHVSLLSQMLSVPFLHIQEANQLDNIKNLDGKKVFMKAFGVNPNNVERLYTLSELNPNQYSQLETTWLDRFPRLQLQVDEAGLSQLSDFPQLGSNHPQLNPENCGAKASNANLLNQVLGPEASLEGLCIPFYYFNEFMQNNHVGELNLRDYILTQLASLNQQAGIEEIQSALTDIRQKITEATIPAESLARIKQAVANQFANTDHEKVRVRSSSNAEDNEFFNGAGLYESDGVKLKHFTNPESSKVAKAIQFVWSSLYSFKAYMARRQFHMDESKVYMGLLINQSFDETARGVSLCGAYEYDQNEIECMTEGYPGGDLKVTHPLPGKLSEISLLRNSQYWVSQYTSELPFQEKIFSDSEAQELYELMNQIYTHWRTEKKPGFSGKLDFEWKRMARADGSSYMILKQVREVPRPLHSGFQAPIFMLNHTTQYRAGLSYAPVGPMALMAYQQFYFQIPLMTNMEDSQSIKDNAQVLLTDFSGADQTVVIKDAEFTVGEWQQADQGYAARRLQLTLKLEHPSIHDLTVHISYEQQALDGVIVSDNLLSEDNLSITSNLSLDNFPDGENPDGLESFSPQMTTVNNLVEVEPEMKRYCSTTGQVVASTVTSQGTGGLYGDGSFNYDSLHVAAGTLESINQELSIAEEHLLVMYNDSHGEGSFPFNVSGAYITTEKAQQLGLNQDHFIVISAIYDDYPVARILLYNSNRELVEEVEVETCDN